jgi:hypothetical protein
MLEKPNDNINHNKDNTGLETEITKKLDKAVKNSTLFCTMCSIKNRILNFQHIKKNYQYYKK